MPTTPIATRIVHKLQQNGHTALFAGGWVRDFLMNRPSDDIDIATSASVEEIQALFPKTIPVGIHFGIIVVVEEGHQFEVATFRKDEGYADGRRPTMVSKATPQEDALRRDFTINGMFYDPVEKKLYDYIGGKKDLDKGIIRAIGDPNERFLEDRLRMMRAVRYSTRFNFPIESDTLQAILYHSSSLIPAVAHERIWQEFKKMSQFAHFDTGLVILHKLNLLPTIFPSLQGLCVEEVQKRVACIEHYPLNAPTIAQLLELFHDSSLEMHLQICEYLKLSNQDKEFARYLYEMRHLLFQEQEKLDEIEPYFWAQKYAHPLSEVTIEIIGSKLPIEKREIFLDHHFQKRQSLAQAILRIRSNSPIVRAVDLQKEGIPPGPEMGKLLKLSEKISINFNLDSREDILKHLKNSQEFLQAKRIKI